jgi:integrase
MGSVEDALTSVEEARLKEHIVKNGSAQDLFNFYMLADFGLRASELAHLEHFWIDEERGTLRIPDKKKCGCADCRKHKKHPGVWTPKTKAGVRTLPVKSAFPDSFEFVLKYLKVGGTLQRNRKKISSRVSALGRKIQREKKDSDGRDLPVYPHCLRSTSAMKFASRSGVTAAHLMAWFGWNRIETANSYMRASGIELDRLFSEK